MVTTRPSTAGGTQGVPLRDSSRRTPVQDAPGRVPTQDRKAPAKTRESAQGAAAPAPEASSAAGATGAEVGGTQRAQRRGDRMYALDGLRFAAAFGVLLYHFTARWHRGWGEDPGEVFPVLGHVSTYFALAPELFFVVSGFVILWTAWGRTVPGVAASRLSRIYPAYWAALALTTFLLMTLWRDGKDISWGEVAVNVTLLQEAFGVRHVDGVYWTLWAELRFYLLIVLLVAIGLTRRRLLVFAAAWPVAGLVAERLGWGLLETLLVSRYAPLFAGGMLLYLIYRDGHARVPWVLLAGNVVLAVHNIVPAQMRSLGRNTVFEPNPWLLGLLTVGCFATVGVVALTRLRRISWAPLATLGALTYPLYLIHEYWGWWAIDRLSPVLPRYVVLGVAIVLSVALAVALHHGVEQRWTPVARRALEARLTAVGERWRRQAPGTPPTTPAGTEPSRIPAHSSALRSSSSWTAEPTPPGR
jgi:peptidoglycan/LPS O-acetylase OafA/YrhL